MILRRITSIAMVCAVAAAASLPALGQQKRGPSTPEERRQALDYIHDLRTNPLGPQSKDERQWLLKWLADVPDLTVHACLILEELPKAEKDSGSIFFGEIAAQAEFLLAHPEQQNDRDAERLAGVEGALQTYEALVKGNPKDKQPYLDDLIQRRDAGTLPQYVQEHTAAACKS